MYNLNSGYGHHLAAALHGVAPTMGKVFVVGDSNTINIDRLRRVFQVDPDGEVRFFNSLEEALNSGDVVANRGDVILLAPGHLETVTAAAGINVDIAGVQIIGLGAGSARPTVNFTTAVGASFRISAADVLVQNVLFTGGIDALTGPVQVQAADVTLRNIETRDVTGQATDFIVTTAAADRLRIDGWVHRGAAAAGADTAISIVGGDGIEIDNFDIDGNFAVACIENVTTAATNLKIGAKSAGTNLARTRNAADVIVTVAAATTGFVNNIFSRLQDNAANITEALVGAAMQFGPNLPIVNANGEASIQWNGTASTDA
jgi:hypothetical protein